MHEAAGRMLLVSPLLAGVRHGFATRQGGTSVGSFASLNLSLRTGDDPARVAENRRRLAEAGGFDLSRLFTVRQVHGAAVALVEPGAEASQLAGVAADAVIASEPGVAVGVFTADCVPVLLADGHGRVGAVHAGWRGTLAGVAVAAVEALVGLGAAPRSLSAAFGPSICAGCFEVGEEVVERFVGAWPEAIRRSPDRRPRIDLRHVNCAQLLAAGLQRGSIDAEPPCTRCHPERFFSYRRDGARIGQHLSFIAP